MDDNFSTASTLVNREDAVARTRFEEVQHRPQPEVESGKRLVAEIARWFGIEQDTFSSGTESEFRTVDRLFAQAAERNDLNGPPSFQLFTLSLRRDEVQPSWLIPSLRSLSLTAQQMVREGHWDEGRILRNSGTYDQPLTSRFTSEQIEQIERASGDDLVTLGGKITKWIARKYRVSESAFCSRSPRDYAITASIFIEQMEKNPGSYLPSFRTSWSRVLSTPTNLGPQTRCFVQTADRMIKERHWDEVELTRKRGLWQPCEVLSEFSRLLSELTGSQSSEQTDRS